MTRGVCRFDAAGRKILPHADMLLYYKGDKESLKIIQSLMPFRYVCLPSVEIHITTTTPPYVRVYLIYPGETKERDIEVSVRALEGLRRAFRGKGGWKSNTSRPGLVVLRREGRVILDPKNRYGIDRGERRG